MDKPLLYLDNCMFNRPFDDQSHIRVRLETEAKLYVQENLIKRENFVYTKWQRHLLNDLSVEELNQQAKNFVTNTI